MIRPVALGSAGLELRAIAPVSRRGRGGALPAALEGRALVAGAGGVRAIADGNRSAILPEPIVEHAGRGWLVGIKGVGAAAPLFGGTPIDDVFAHDFDPAIGVGTLPARAIAGESWMGESPYGAQGAPGASQALEITALAGDDATIEGAPICPVIDVLELPDETVRRDLFWYRRHEGPFLQEIRLVPSDVRVFHSSDRALARDAEAVLEGFGVGTLDGLDAFVDRFLASGIALLTLFARTARRAPDGSIEGLDYHDAWIDKDCLVGADGTLFVADLESVEWTPTTHRAGVEARVRHQIDRNAYELLYGLDALLDVRDRWADRASDARARRASLATRLELALAGDRHVALEGDDQRVDLVIAARTGERVRARFLDRR